MKVLMIFLDMIRPNRLSTFNKNIKIDTPLDISLQNIGGTFYSNCFTTAPDTPRGMASFATGQVPNLNGCNTRVKWPRYFLNKEQKTIYDLFLEQNYKISMFSNPNERQTGLFPEHVSLMDIHNHDYDLNKYLSNIKLENDHLVFVSLPDFHWSFGDNGYSTYGEKIAYKDISQSFEMIFDNFDKDEFDHIFIFSDHGFKFRSELFYSPKYMLLNDDRTKILLIHREKGRSTNFNINDKLCAITDIYPTVDYILNGKKTETSLLNDSERGYVLIEDHLEFAPAVNQNIGIWALVTNELIYVRTLKDGHILYRGGDANEEINPNYDEILKKETSFGFYLNEYNKIFSYRELLFKQTNFMHGGERKKIPTVYNYINILRDLIWRP